MSTSIHKYLPQHADRLLKLAKKEEPRKLEKYFPWYGAAGLGMTGYELGKLLPGKKLQTAGRIGGTLLGTAAGVHGGEALGKALDKKREKTAEKEEPKKSKAKEVGKIVGKGVAGLGLGTIAGAGLGFGLERGAEAIGRPIPVGPVLKYGLPIAGAGLGAAYSLWKAREQDELNRALQSNNNKSK